MLLRRIIAATLLLTSYALHARHTYMGGAYPLIPQDDCKALNLRPGTSTLMEATPAADSEMRLSALMSLSRKGDIGSGFAICTPADTLAITLREAPARDYIYERDRLLLTLTSPQGQPVTLTLPATPDRYRLGKEAALTLILTPAAPGHTHATLRGGRTQDHELWDCDTLPLPYTDISAIGFTAADIPLTVTRAVLTTSPAQTASAEISPADIPALIARATDPYSGYWTLLDYTLEDSMLRPGGDYLLALIPAADGDYDIIYLDGATVNPGLWHEGRHKGHLTPTRLPGLYRALWIDAEGQSLESGATLQFTGTDIAILTLPTLRSSLRLHRVRP